MEILVYQTAEEAERNLEKYKKENEEAFDKFMEFQREEQREEQREKYSDAKPKNLENQTFFFVAELAAYVGGGPEKFYFESKAFPFLGWNNPYDDISSLAQGIKDTVRFQTPKNIETVLYTVENHDEENQSMEQFLEEEKEELKEFKEKLNGFFEQFLQGYEKLLEELLEEDDKVRGLTEQEREEFVRWYNKE